MQKKATNPRHNTALSLTFGMKKKRSIIKAGQVSEVPLICKLTSLASPASNEQLHTCCLKAW